MVAFRSLSSASRSSASAGADIATDLAVVSPAVVPGAHALRPGAHRRRGSRSLVSWSTGAAVVLTALTLVMTNEHSAVADDIVPSPQPTATASVDGSGEQADPTASPQASESAPAPKASATAVKARSGKVSKASKILPKAAAHKESTGRASRAGRRGTKAYNLVYTATYASTAMGWSSREVSCLTKLWAGESNFRPMARNRRSGAYGIPQALPGRKMRVEGSDWKTNPDTQIRWGVKYVKVKYGTPCRALKFKHARGWY
ncbi:MAG: hypothetical protein KGP01_05045 [Actinomycetales bacterium]|nr:hypothetical protein [Actinomycetales bacterium]